MVWIPVFEARQWFVGIPARLALQSLFHLPP
jgi:hypothetical protein